MGSLSKQFSRLWHMIRALSPWRLPGLPQRVGVSLNPLTPDHISDDALSNALALVCTSLHDSIDRLLGAEPSTLEPASQILASYAEIHLAELFHSDVHLQGLVAIHHAVNLLPRCQSAVAVDAAVSIWKQCQTLPDAEAAILQSAILDSLVSLLQTPSSVRYVSFRTL